MKITLDVNVPEGYEPTGQIPVTGSVDEAGMWIVVGLCKKKSKVIVFVPVDSFEEATVEGYGLRYGIFGGRFGSWYNVPSDQIQWLRQEEREESI